MEFVREIRQVESTNLFVKLPEHFVHHAVEILVLPYPADRQATQTEPQQKPPGEELEELRQYYRTFDAPLTLQTLTALKEELYRDLF